MRCRIVSGRLGRRSLAVVVLCVAMIAPAGAAADAAPAGAIEAHLAATTVRFGAAATVLGSVTPASLTTRVVVQRGVGA